MTTITLTIADLDRTAHALLLAKIGYLCDAVDNTSGTRWQEAHRNIDALNDLYAQIDAALPVIA